MTESKTIAVIGAGPMGLACAYQLAKSGHRVNVYEAGSRPGGMSASFDFDGLQIERYYHFICATDYPLFDALDELGLKGHLRWNETRMGFYYEGRLYPWGRPDKLLLFPHLSLVSKFRYALHVLRAKGVKDWHDLDRIEATTWIRRWIGEEAFRVLWEPLFRLKFYEHAKSLSAAWIGTRIQRVARSRTSIFREQMGYLEGGSEIIVKAYCGEIEKRGGRIVLNAPIERVLVDQGHTVGVKLPMGIEACTTAISTVPLKYVSPMVPELTADERNRIDSIENIGVVCVILKLKHKLTDYFWTNINDRSMAIPGMIEYTNLNPLAQHVVYVPFYMPKTHPKWNDGADSFINEVKDYLKRISKEFSDHSVLAAHASRYEFAQTVCTPGFYDALPPMRTSVGGFFMADTAYYYPEDRSICESIRVGKELARLANEAA